MASAEFRPLPSVWTVNGAEPETEIVEAAWPVTLPADGELKVMVHWPAVSVLAPAFVQVPVGAVAAAPFEFVSVTVTCSLLAATKPLPSPMSFCSVTVKVCGCPTMFVADGAIAILALTQRFIAGPELGATPSVERVIERPPTETVAEARTAQTPVTAEVRLIEQEPVPPEVVQLPEAPLLTLKLTDVPSGAFTGPVPSFTLTCAVKMWL